MEEIWFLDEQIRDEELSRDFDVTDPAYQRMKERRNELKGWLDEIKDNEKYV